MSPTPVVILTGYLGAGKTTVLNHILKSQNDYRCAVIINEYGEVGIDNDLVLDSEEEIIEMNNGCICCKVRGDLVRILEVLKSRRHLIDCVVIETTGLADPAPVAQTFLADPQLQNSFSLLSIVTVVDSVNFEQQAAETEEAMEQVAFADLVLLSKVDLVSSEAADAVMAKVRKVNPTAELVLTDRKGTPVRKIFELDRFSLPRLLDLEPALAINEPIDHDHSDDVQSLAIIDDRMLDIGRFDAWVSRLLETDGDKVLRIKGILSSAAYPTQKYVFHAVHMIAEGRCTEAWGTAERTSKIVFIVRDLDLERIREGFLSCLIAAAA